MRGDGREQHAGLPVRTPDAGRSQAVPAPIGTAAGRLREFVGDQWGDMNEVPSAGGAVEVGTTALAFEPVRERPHDAARLRSLAQLGLGAQADPKMQAVAERVQRWLDVPIALVSLVGPDRHVFPGMTGLPEPWATSRSAPLRHRSAGTS